MYVDFCKIEMIELFNAFITITDRYFTGIIHSTNTSLPESTFTMYTPFL